MHREDDQASDRKAGMHRDPEHRREVVGRPATSGRWRAGGPRTRRPCRATGAGRNSRRADAAGAMSATSASRGAPRMPLPIRSMKRAAISQPMRRRQRKNRLGEGGEAVAGGREPFALAEPIRECAGEYLGDRGGRFGDAFDDADGQRRGAERRDQIDRQQRMDHLRRDIHEQSRRSRAPRRRAGIARQRNSERESVDGSGLHLSPLRQRDKPSDSSFRVKRRFIVPRIAVRPPHTRLG